MRISPKPLASPTASLWLLAVALPIIRLSAPTTERRIIYEDILLRWLLPLIIAAWVIRDARNRKRALCYDYGTFVFFAWPILVPVYLFQTRGKWALVTLIYFVAICAASAIEHLFLVWLLY